MKAILYAVGIGPGSWERMTEEAQRILLSAETIAGYSVYVELIQQALGDKEYLTTPMRQEKERCHMALLAAASGKRTAMVCSGDAGVYGMAGLLYEIAAKEFSQVEIRVVAGVTAALSGAALLGAPVGHDFAVISLSDLLTPWETIERRLRASASADFSICLYNPSSRKRRDYLKRACQIAMEYQVPETVCGYAKNVGREGEYVRILSLAELMEEETDMFTTVFIGNSQTKRIGGAMVTPRGYAGEGSC